MMGEWLHNCMASLLSLPSPMPSQVKRGLETYRFCLGWLGTQKFQEDARLQVSKSNSLVLSKIFFYANYALRLAEVEKLSHFREKLTAIYRSCVAKTNPTLPLPDCEADPYFVMAVSQEL